MIGLLGLVLTLAITGIAFWVSKFAGIAAFEIAFATALLIGYGADFSLRPSAVGFGAAISPELFKTYRIFHLYVRYPFFAMQIANLINWVRIVGIGVILYALWNKYWILAGIPVALFLLSGSIIARLAPQLYFKDAAAAGNALAAQHWSDLQRIVEQWRTYGESSAADVR